ncbi:uncharacterized protein EV422DRAFT_182303 [Fimicolochytrium jonesii]|uniref:uncharacterized protein n=1 Tax=Fimicolochytrium jonesii TaxID=1396493 RepID=UPI0022FEB322|nr:uncharacterized protein EV422DRAFT_182303 [Fimicolochytrium jonesii]KAI8818348.1 hypothetical protein EV422DRAFT_182303 [Fimicolochytrium jonesii]
MPNKPPPHKQPTPPRLPKSGSLPSLRTHRQPTPYSSSLTTLASPSSSTTPLSSLPALPTIQTSLSAAPHRRTRRPSLVYILPPSPRRRSAPPLFLVDGRGLGGRGKGWMLLGVTACWFVGGMWALVWPGVGNGGDGKEGVRMEIPVPMSTKMYYAMLVPLLPPVTIFFVFFNWLGLKFFRHNA